MAGELSSLDTIFCAAVEIASPEERAAYIAGACGDDAGLRASVEKLVGAHFRAGDFLAAPPVDPYRTCEVPPGPAGALGERPRFGQVGPYKLLQPIGEGGMGTVWMAEQQQPVHRRVALKLIKDSMYSRDVVARFEAERQALALMDHPNIARVLDAGATPEGRPYFVMELVHGVTITRYCDEARLTPRRRLELFLDVCAAVQHAHQKGVIHRDLKPSNVLVTLCDGRPVPKVIDFGVAKATEQRLTERTLFTLYGTVVGTLEYMSPEQAEMSALGVDTRSDVYSLGVLLYELLTGTTPLSRDQVRAAGYAELLRLIKEEEPPRPSTRLSSSGEELVSISARRDMEPARLTRLVRGELDWIVMRALEKDRNRRYESAGAFAADVGRYLADEPVQACPPSPWYRFRKFARRNQRAVAMAAALALGLVLAVGALATSTVLIARALKSETEARGQLDDALRRETREAYFHRITLAHHALSADNLGRALKLLAECPEELRGWEWHYLMRLCRVEPVVLRDTTEVNSVAFSPDGEHLASAGGDGALKVFNSRTGQVVRAFKAHKGSVAAVAFHPGGKHLASTGADRQVKVWDWPAGREVFSEPCDAIRKFGTGYSVAFSPDGRLLAAGNEGTVTVWDWEGRQPVHTFHGHDNHSVPVAFSRDGRRLATGGAFREGQKVWDADTGGGGRPLHTFPAHRHPVSAVAFSPDGGRLASASIDRRVNLWDMATGELLHTFWHTGIVDGVAFSPDGRRIASGGEDKTVRVWDADSGREVLGLRGHTGRCGCVAFSPDGRRLASASTDGTIRLWDATPLRGDESQEALNFTRHSDVVYSVAFSPDGHRVASAGHDPLVKVWEVKTGRVSAEFGGHGHVVFCVAWHPDGQRIASAGSQGRLHAVKVWGARDRREAFAVKAGREQSAVPYFAAAFSPNGRYLVTGSLNGAVQVWDAKAGREVGTLGVHGREIGGVVFSRDGKRLATASADGAVALWDATRLHEVKGQAPLPLDKSPLLHRALTARVPGACLNVAFSPDGGRLATAGEENTVKIWDVQTGEELKMSPLRGHSGEVYAVAFSPDREGRWVASGGEDSAVKVWDSRTGKLVRSFRGHIGLVSSLAFSPDGKRLASGSRDHTVKVWDLSKLAEQPNRQ